VTKDGNCAHVRTGLHEPLQNIPAMLPGVVCVQYVTRGKKRHAYHARFWRERGKLRKQYIRKCDVEGVRAACEARRSTGSRRPGGARRVAGLAADIGNVGGSRLRPALAILRVSHSC